MTTAIIKSEHELVKSIEEKTRIVIKRSDDDVMGSGPGWVNYYNDILQDYVNVLNVCMDYYEHKNILEFFKKLDDIHMFFNVVNLKEKIQNSKLLLKICQFETELYLSKIKS